MNILRLLYSQSKTVIQQNLLIIDQWKDLQYETVNFHWLSAPHSHFAHTHNLPFAGVPVAIPVAVRALSNKSRKHHNAFQCGFHFFVRDHSYQETYNAWWFYLLFQWWCVQNLTDRYGNISFCTEYFTSQTPQPPFQLDQARCAMQYQKQCMLYLRSPVLCVS